MGKFSFFRIFYGKKLYGKLFSVPVNCSLRAIIIETDIRPEYTLYTKKKTHPNMHVHLYSSIFVRARI